MLKFLPAAGSSGRPFYCFWSYCFTSGSVDASFSRNRLKVFQLKPKCFRKNMDYLASTITAVPLVNVTRELPVFYIWYYAVVYAMVSQSKVPVPKSCSCHWAFVSGRQRVILKLSNRESPCST